MPKTVLVPLDGSDDAMRAMPVASALGHRFGADVVLVAAQLPGDTASGNWLRDALEAVHPAGARCEVVWSLSVPDALRAVADDADEVIVCMATHARARVGRALFGSVAEDVVRRLEIPAVLVGPHFREPWRADGPLLVCLDGSAASEAILPVARDWALTLGIRVVLSHVFHPLDVETALMPEAVVGRAAACLAPDVDVDTRVLRGRHPAGTLVDLGDELDSSIVALATHGRTGTARVALGSVATGVVRRSSCPVLVVRPDVLTPDIEPDIKEEI